MPVSLLDLATGWARRDGRREALVAGEVRLTYSELMGWVERVAGKLSRAGLRPGDRVAFFGSPAAAFLVIELATHRVGGVWLGLN